MRCHRRSQRGVFGNDQNFEPIWSLEPPAHSRPLGLLRDLSLQFRHHARVAQRRHVAERSTFGDVACRRRMILPERVFGKLSAQTILFGRANRLPRAKLAITPFRSPGVPRSEPSGPSSLRFDVGRIGADGRPRERRVPD